MIKILLKLLVWSTLLSASSVFAHFQTLIPSTESVSAATGRVVTFDIRFTHPMAWGPVMEMGMPVSFGVIVGGEQKDLRPALHKDTVDNRSAYLCTYTVDMPGDHLFYIEPAPYWEAAERKMIVHYTKVVVDVFGAQENWDALVGMPVEIQPLTRPYGLWSSNLFTGIVLHNGMPVPHAVIEVEYYNKDRRLVPPAEPYITQVIKADSRGIFSYSMPWSGWWGFAALIDGTEKMLSPAGDKVEVELGGVLWIRAREHP